jgi:glyoxylase-like metal-dependent hydrolase (beta-lactamase superfamily II)
MQDRLWISGLEVAVVCEGYAPLPLDAELPAERIDWDAERASAPWAFLDRQSWAWHVHAFGLRTPEGVVMVDTGLGGFPPFRPWAEHTDRDVALAASGIDPTDVVAVVHTHLHADHAGGAVVSERPRFPNAIHHVHPSDWAHFGHPDRIDGYTARGPMAELERLGMVDLTPDDHEVAPGVRVLHAPGHTPGHRVAVLTAGDETLLLVGDLLHIPTQVARPHARSSHDDDPDEGSRSRVRVLSDAREGRTIVAVSHFARPFGRVTADGWIGAT